MKNSLKKVILSDTRTAFEYICRTADGFIHIPLYDLRECLSGLDKDKKIYVMCRKADFAVI